MSKRNHAAHENAGTERLHPGDRVRVFGAGKDWLGTVSEREMPDGTKAIHPPSDDTAVFVKIDETGISLPVSKRQVEKLSGRRH